MTTRFCWAQKQADLLNKLSKLGAAGVRLDATKHIAEVLFHPFISLPSAYRMQSMVGFTLRAY